MKNQILRYSYLISVMLVFSQAIHTQSGLPAQLKAVDNDFCHAIDKQSVRQVRAVIPQYERLIASAKEIGDRHSEAISTTRLGHAQALTGQMSRALTNLKLAFGLWESLGAPLDAANVLNTLGSLQYATEDYENARQSLEKASVLRAGLDNPGELNTRVALGGVYKALQTPQKSAESYAAALSLSQTVNDKIAIGFVQERMAQRGSIARVEHLTRAVEAYREGGKQPELTDGVTNRVLIKTGDGIAAFQQLDRAKFRSFKTDKERQEFLSRPRSLGIIPLTYDEGDRGRGAVALANLGQAYSSENRDRVSALALLNEALDWSRSAGSSQSEGFVLGCLSAYHAIPTDNERFLLFTTLIQLNTIHDGARKGFERDGKTNGPRASIELGLIRFERQRNKFVSEELRAAFTVEVRRYFERFIDLLMDMHAAEPDGGHDKLALKASELARSRALRDSLRVSGVDLRSGIDPELLKRELEIRNKLNALAEGQDRSSTANRSAESVKDQIGILTLEYAEVHGKIRQEKLKGVPVELPDADRFARIRSEFRLVFKEEDPTEPLPFTIFDIQNELADSNTVLLEYFVGDERSYVWAVTGTNIDSYELPGRKDIERLAKQTYRQIMDLAGNSQKSRSTYFISEDAQELSDVVLGPMADKIKGKRLAIVADGALQYVPFSALPQPRAKAATNSNSSQPLAVTNEIVSLPSASVLSVLRREAASRMKKGAGIAVVADPVFSETDERLPKGENVPKKDEKTELSRKTLERAFSFTTDKNQPLAIPRLPFTRREAESIFSSAPKGASLKALDFEADRERVLKTDLSKYRIIHFATHGILHSEHPDLSGIVLSLVNEKGEAVNGFLRLNEIYNLNLNADLVVLSACQTALGKEVRGEGLIGLTRGFMYAGSSRVVASLWKVDDVATAELMKIFYQKMLKEKMRPAAALRAAKIAMMKQKRWSAPYYWAAFELQGEWR